MISFNTPYKFENNFNEYPTCGDNKYTWLCHKWFEVKFKCKKALLTTSCTHALEMAAILLDIKEDDEIIMSSYTFVSTANAFVLRGAKIVFVDIRPDTMNIDETKIEAAITPKTKVIVPVHYAGIACDMDSIMAIAKKHNLFVVEDSAQGVMSSYKEQALGTIGDIGCYSFHETKNYSMGEGGAIIINNDKFIERAEIIREKGTNRSNFFRGQVDKYSWVDIGSSYLPSDILAYYLYTQLVVADKINNKRLSLWKNYYISLRPLSDKKLIELPTIPNNCQQNGHMFYIKVKNLKIRNKLIRFLKDNNITAPFHYVPLHSSEYGKHNTKFTGKDIFTTTESKRLLRLPMFYNLETKTIKYIVNYIKEFFSANER
ncbi:dTDP-4-amino-4,6-dideoxygalactose transaminase [Francisella orientalis]|uniref:3-oxoacyl-(Acyl-carrier-protein) synthase III n=1 Tax=Francisella orientalis TaxID=299583 RepID=A0AAP6XAI3_9GAMM|nr:dTDP-4-amino-4,6-dideoxygalactose transaminase [Francisella orientalis]AFJ43288.1 3-oxoacyl-(acyl-carrier-protein) synthase III [Francisella orientalis str. Toba 04]AHB98780.1 TDP-4-oxo-6-deoxy-D-glucose aminotransferase [Francisella orientalis LADL 07-285A]AKN86045.1 3-oxoacyl-(Acyl-carrier-protein) synthase III [Francisella orientalis FNO12]AKN87583.1 3-oxoacyl-(Acyl-carrier-protein) synthase III [Francisella orientalis FNO24]AKN89121.1 3-oxoacyl-(Acyl-carrier-protein) synthase III [Franc